MVTFYFYRISFLLRLSSSLSFKLEFSFDSSSTFVLTFAIFLSILYKSDISNSSVGRINYFKTDLPFFFIISYFILIRPFSLILTCFDWIESMRSLVNYWMESKSFNELFSMFGRLSNVNFPMKHLLDLIEMSWMTNSPPLRRLIST